MEKLTFELLQEILPTAANSDDYDLLCEAVMMYRAIYFKATFLITTGQREVNNEERKIIFDKDYRLDRLNQYLQSHKKRTA